MKTSEYGVHREIGFINRMFLQLFLTYQLQRGVYHIGRRRAMDA